MPTPPAPRVASHGPINRQDKPNKNRSQKPSTKSVSAERAPVKMRIGQDNDHTVNDSSSTKTSRSSTTIEKMASIRIDPQADERQEVLEIRATGDIILDVTFETTLECEKSIRGERFVLDMRRDATNNNAPPPSVRRFYRVRMDTLKKTSKYFDSLLGVGFFGEGTMIKAVLTDLEQRNIILSEAEPDLLPRIKIVDEEDATRTMDRDKVFEDLLHIVHGGNHVTEPKLINLNYIAVLTIMADRFDCMAPVSRYIAGSSNVGLFKYPANPTEEVLRKKILVFYLTNRIPRFANGSLESCTKELIIRGSSYWNSYDEKSHMSSALWWNLPGGLEVELAHRRKCILSTITSLQTHFLSLYTSKVRVCSLGYDSSPACDSYQLGEMVKFLINKKLLSLVPVTAISAEDPNFIWPEGYRGNLDEVITLLRQCPNYQIDRNHGHCGLRSKILRPLDCISSCLGGIGINGVRWQKDRDGQSWIEKPQSSKAKKPSFVVGEKIFGEEKRVFEFDPADSSALAYAHNSLGIEKFSKVLFTAGKWIWTRNEPTSVTAAG